MRRVWRSDNPIARATPAVEPWTHINRMIVMSRCDSPSLGDGREEHSSKAASQVDKSVSYQGLCPEMCTCRDFMRDTWPIPDTPRRQLSTKKENFT